MTQTTHFPQTSITRAHMETLGENPHFGHFGHTPEPTRRIIGRISLPDPPFTDGGEAETETMEAPQAKAVVGVDEREARRIAGELLRAHRDGVLPEDERGRRLIATAIHLFDASYVPDDGTPTTTHGSLVAGAQAQHGTLMQLT